MPDHPTHPSIRLMDGFWYQTKPYDDYRWMRENAPIYRDEAGGVWGVSLHEDIMSVSKNAEIFCSGKSSRPEEGSLIPSMINFDDPVHKRRRNLVNRGFTPRQLLAHEKTIRQICRELVDAVAPKGRCEFVHEVAAPLPMAIIGNMLGVRPEDRDMLLGWSDDFIKATGNSEPAVLEAAQKAGIEYFQYASEVIADRRSKPPGDDLMSILVHAEIDGEKLDDDAIRQEGLLILVGGDETTRHVITEGMEALIRNPDQRQKLIDDPSKIPTAVEELLRWVSPIKNMNRTATCDTELRGQKISEGDKLLLLYQSGNRDANVFENPDTLDVERDPNNHVAFGGYGAHFCLGASLARLEMCIMFEEVLTRLPDMEIASSDPLPMRPSNFIVGIEEMPVEFTPA